MKNPKTPLATAGFLLSKVGQLATARFALRLAPLKIRPRHCGLLVAAAHGPASQEELSRVLGLVPSAIVGMVDDLEALSAVRRISDPKNRRRYTIELTKRGHALLAQCSELAHEVDGEILNALSSAQRASLTSLLKTVATTLGLPINLEELA